MEEFTFEKDFIKKEFLVTCRFHTPLRALWEAFTKPSVQEKWFAPKPFKAITQSSDFKPGGHWHYYMLSPAGEKYWGLTRYLAVYPNKSYEAIDGFCDENGVIDTNLPQMNWHFEFTSAGGETQVRIRILTSGDAAMRKILDMGFEEGYLKALGQLRELVTRKRKF